MRRILPLLLMLACTEPGEDPFATDTDGRAGDSAAAVFRDQDVLVTLDGEPTAGIAVRQGGGSRRWLTDAEGRATVRVDTTIVDALTLIAAHPDARASAHDAAFDETVLIELLRFDPSDNEAYPFSDPGELEGAQDNAECAHCHFNIRGDFQDSEHRTSASNPAVQDLYAGVATTLASQEACEEQGGSWWVGLEPGTRAASERCYLGAGALPDLNEGCGDTGACDEVATHYGQCADCHAPAIDGVLGGRDLLEATGSAYDYGVSCDPCHAVESVDLSSDEPGVAGRLHLVRPSEAASVPGIGEWLPLTFGPFEDVPNVMMGAVQRDHYANSELCAGCHQHDQAVLVPDAVIDTSRWPDSRLPVHSTWDEWEAGPMNPAAPCGSCHMPPDPDAGNAAALEHFVEEGSPITATTGWWRDPGSVRRHVWFGPRHPEERMVDLAAAIHLDASDDGETLTVSAEVANVGPGHAIPTGEPLRSLLLLVEATCDGAALAPVGGHVVPDFGGELDRQDSDADWSSWPGAEVGDVVRVLAVEGWHDYTGFGPFGDGTFDAEAKGLPVETWVGEATIAAVDGDTVTFDALLPEGDVAVRGRAAALPADGEDAAPRAGAPGFGFARVMVDTDGERMVPHHRAVDVVSDNRLLPTESFTSTHQFSGGCEEPEVHAVLVHRAYPLELAQQRGWTLTETVMAEAWL